MKVEKEGVFIVIDPFFSYIKYTLFNSRDTDLRTGGVLLSGYQEVRIAELQTWNGRTGETGSAFQIAKT